MFGYLFGYHTFGQLISCESSFIQVLSSKNRQANKCAAKIRLEANTCSQVFWDKDSRTNKKRRSDFQSVGVSNKKRVVNVNLS